MGCPVGIRAPEGSRYRSRESAALVFSSPLPPMSTTPLSAVAEPTSRRDFFKRAGLGIGAVAVVSNLAACDSDPVDGDAIVLDFSSDVGVLNYAYALEQLEAGFYATVVGDAAFGTTFNADEQAIMRDLAAHEAIHSDFFRLAISDVATAIPALTPDFSSIDFTSRTNVLAVAQTFEDLGVSAYNGAGKYIQDNGYLTLAGKIVSVEARHASVIAGLIQDNSIAASGQINAQGLDLAREPGAVLQLASTYITDTIRVTNVPS